MTYKELKALAANEIEKGLKESLNAPTKRGWSRMTGQPVMSKNDCLQAMNTNVRNISNVTSELFPKEKSIITEEVAVEPVKLS